MIYTKRYFVLLLLLVFGLILLITTLNYLKPKRMLTLYLVDHSAIRYSNKDPELMSDLIEGFIYKENIIEKD